MPKIRNIIIFVAIAAIFVLLYIFYIKPPGATSNLVSSSSTTTLPNVDIGEAGAGTNPAKGTPFVAQDFLQLLLNVKNIKLEDSIFADPAFGSLHDSSIILTGDGTEGRPNPFAQFGNDATPPDTTNPPAATQDNEDIPPPPKP